MYSIIFSMEICILSFIKKNNCNELFFQRNLSDATQQGKLCVAIGKINGGKKDGSTILLLPLSQANHNL